MSLTFRWTCPIFTRGSIAMRPQRYRAERDAREPPEAVRHPGIADHIGLHREDERRSEGSSDADRRPPACAPRGDDERGEDRKTPHRPDEGSQETRLCADLGVIGLARLDRRLRPRGRLTGVPQPVALRVMDDGAHTLAQADPMAVNRRLIDAAGVASGARLFFRNVALLDEILLRPLPLGRHVRERVHPDRAY